MQTFRKFRVCTERRLYRENKITGQICNPCHCYPLGCSVHVKERESPHQKQKKGGAVEAEENTPASPTVEAMMEALASGKELQDARK